MHRYFVFLSNRPGYELKTLSLMEGMESEIKLYEKPNRLFDARQLGPTIVYSTAQRRWVALDPRDQFELSYFEGYTAFDTNYIGSLEKID